MPAGKCWKSFKRNVPNKNLKTSPSLISKQFLTLHGHIHESRRITGIDTVEIGRTTVHQPGQERLWRHLIYSIVDIEGNAVLVERRRGFLG